MNSIITSIKKNWKTNLIALVVFTYSVPQVVTAIQAWGNHQSADWRGAAVGLLLTIGMLASKDAGNVPTQGEVNNATAKETAKDTANIIKWQK